MSKKTCCDLCGKELRNEVRDFPVNVTGITVYIGRIAIPLSTVVQERDYCIECLTTESVRSASVRMWHNRGITDIKGKVVMDE